jgi:hypothetical protein
MSDIKLADFGVAGALDDISEMDVAGTPVKKKWF